MTGGYIALLCWSAFAGLWWLIAIVLIIIGPRRCHSKEALVPVSLTVFKSIPPVRNDVERDAVAEAMKSFVVQLDHNDEMLIGVEETALPGWEGIFERWRADRPAVQIKVIAQPVPLQRANPKVAWMEILSPNATRELWLWSDADVVAPPAFLESMKKALNGSEVNAVTAAYVIRNVRKAAGMIDALFVNAEILPGALLLARLNARDFAYGAATLFRAAKFRECVDWADLGSELADDHELGRRLTPVALSDAIVSTFTLPQSWRDALEHYYRWQKTVRWCRPSGFAAMLLVNPLIGWAVSIALEAGSRVAVTGFLCQWVFEILVGIVICSVVGCRLNPRTWMGLFLWPIVRAASWLAVWLPLRVVWGGRRPAWSEPRREA